MAINLSDVIAEIESRYNNIDSSTSALEQFRINSARDRLNNSGVYAQTYRSTGHLPTITDSAYLGNIAQVEVDNVFGDSDGAFYMATARDSGWVRMTTLQDSDEAAIEAPAAASEAYSFQGSVSGYTTGGYPLSNVIDKFPFASDTNATDAGDLTQSRYLLAGSPSSVSGYSAGGSTIGPQETTIDKFPFAADGNATDVGDLAAGRYDHSGHSSGDDGFVAGGTYAAGTKKQIDKYSHTSDGNATDVGDLLTATDRSDGQSSSTHGYVSGGSPGYKDNIEKFPFAISSGTATDVGNLTVGRLMGAGQSSTTHGYYSGGNSNPYSNVIDKFSFSSDGNATDVGDITVARDNIQYGHSSTTHGYTGNGTSSGGLQNIVDKFSFASDGNATDALDLSAARTRAAGLQT